MSMAHRRIALLALVLASAAALLAAAPGALALPRAIINQFVGPRGIRAEVLVLAADGTTAQDYRIDRGVILFVTPASLTIRESNGDTVAVPLGSGTQVQGRGAAPGGLRRGMRIVVYQLAGAPAQIVQGEGIDPQFFWPRLIRAEVLLLGAGGVTQDFRIDRGVVVSAVSGTLTLRESDGTTAPLSVDPNAQVQGGGRRATATTLRKGTHVVVYRSANAAAELVQVEAGP
jgi:hypothetical protein